MSRVVGTEKAIQKIRTVHRTVMGIVTSSEVENFLLSRVLARYDAGVDPNNNPWPGLSAETIRSKKAKGYPFPERLLYAKGNLRRAIGIIRGVNAGLLAGATGLGFRIGVRDYRESQIGRLHNYGLGGQEKRQFIGVSPLDARALSGFFNRKLKSISNG